MDPTRMGFWDGQQGQGRANENLVLDNWRHRQVTYGPGSNGQDNNAMRGLGGTSGSFDIEREMDRNRIGDATQQNRIGDVTLSASRGLGGSGNGGMDMATRGQVGLANLHLSQGSGMSNLPLDANPSSSLASVKSIAEMSARRLEGVKAAFRRVDPRGQGFTTPQDLSMGLQRYTNLGGGDQQRVLQGIIGSNQNGRIPFTQFLAYYQALGSQVERDRDFEDLIRHHWGFPEVCDILDDMKNKFMMVGLAYTFRRGLEQGIPELSEQAFQQAISQVGMQYSQDDVRRVFDSFDPSGGGNNSSLEVLKLTSHLTSAPKPPTPMPALYGSAHFSEVNSQIDPGDRPPATPQMSGSGAGIGKHPEPPTAPPETPEISELDNPNSPAPEAPPEDEDDGVEAPPEAMGNPNEPAPEAPPEDGDGDMAPDEKRKDDGDDDDVAAPGESGSSGVGAPYGSSPMGGYGSPQPGMSQPYGGQMGKQKSQYQMSSAMAGNSIPSGRRRAVTVGINYIGTRNALAGCINDSDTFIKLLTGEFGFAVSDIRQLRDDHPQRMPSGKNIKAALNWLVSGAKAGDHLFFHYSGHGSQQKDAQGDERDGKDETMVPCDFQSHGMITDDDLRRMLVLPLPQGSRLTVILDCCHSGTLLDLPFRILVDPDGESAKLKKKNGFRTRPSDADVVMISGCMDTQTSADIGAGSCGNSAAAGAMTTAFKTVMEQTAEGSYLDIIVNMRKFLRAKGFKQVPQLSSERFLNLSECFMPEVEPPTADPPPATRPPQRRALSIGINYLTLAPGRGRLSGCINDSETMMGILRDTWQMQENQIRRLRDDRANMMPTKQNIMDGIRWLTQGAQNGDEFFLHYSGHGGQQRDKTGDERDGKDETILPCDFQTAGQITDDDLNDALVDALPAGVRMWVIMDCCHSGTALDLEFKITLEADGSITCKKKSQIRKGRGLTDPRQRAMNLPEIIMLSGCKDTQTSADISGGSLGVTKAAGAMTTAFRHTINQSINCVDLLTNMRAYLKRNGFDQVPQMSSAKNVQLDCSFVHYQEKKKGKRDLPPSLVASMPTQAVAYNPGAMAGQMPGYPMSPDMGGAVTGDPLSYRLQALEQEIANLRTQSPQNAGMSPGYSGASMIPGSQPMSPMMSPGFPAGSPGMQGAPYSPSPFS